MPDFQCISEQFAGPRVLKRKRVPHDHNSVHLIQQVRCLIPETNDLGLIDIILFLSNRCYKHRG